MTANARAIDRVMPPEVGGYPVNYGFVPQTISYDGDPFDVLVLGLPLAGRTHGTRLDRGPDADGRREGARFEGRAVAVDGAGRATHTLTGEDRDRIGNYFDTYKRHEPGGFSNVPGWGSPADGLAHVRMTHAFFQRCRGTRSAPCRVDP